MKTLQILSIILWAALSIRAATVAPVEAAEEQQDKPAPKTEAETDTAVAAGRAPASPQARFSFCLDDWISDGDNCYYLSNIYDTWGNAESYCASFDSSLASARNIWEYAFLQRMVKTGGHTFAWIGGYHFEGVWRWEDGSRFDYYNWEVSNSPDIYQCLALNSRGTKGWSNHGCSTRFPFVCKRRLKC